VTLCVSDAHAGQRAAIGQVLGWLWQRRTVHFLRDMLGYASKAEQPMIATAIRQVFAAASGDEARERLAESRLLPRDRTPCAARASPAYPMGRSVIC
jgi:transposase-like protein